jgi:acetate kinase
MHVLVVNAGSSSLKIRLLDPDDQVVDRVDIERWSGSDETERLEQFLSAVDTVEAVGHRIVHGGPDFTGPTPITADTRDRIAALSDLAPLHQPRGVAGIDAVAKVLPDAPAVACFDTTFHHTLPDAAATYALPHEWNERWNLRRYGFHGLSHAYVARRAAHVLGQAAPRIVSCHLGAGASLAAVKDGRSVDTTMGFTPLEGLVMATRSGSIDPGLLLWLLRHTNLDANQLSDTLEHHSGLAGLTGGSGDLRDIHPTTRAFDVYVHRLRREIAAMTAALNGLDVLAFTGGVGEHQPTVRAAATTGLAYLGIAIDHPTNHTATGDTNISAPGAGVHTLVLTAREDLEIAHQTRTALTDTSACFK